MVVGLGLGLGLGLSLTVLLPKSTVGTLSYALFVLAFPVVGFITTPVFVLPFCIAPEPELLASVLMLL